MNTIKPKITLGELREALGEYYGDKKPRGAWNIGVKEYAESLLCDGDISSSESFGSVKELEKALLDGCENWKDYSYNGMSLIYNYHICQALCPISLQRRKQFGMLPPNSQESWLDVQARALFQAGVVIARVFVDLQNKKTAEEVKKTGWRVIVE